LRLVDSTGNERDPSFGGESPPCEWVHLFDIDLDAFVTALAVDEDGTLLARAAHGTYGCGSQGFLCPVSRQDRLGGREAGGARQDTLLVPLAVGGGRSRPWTRFPCPVRASTWNVMPRAAFEPKGAGRPVT
jgi:hypothetical protein